MCQGGDPGAPRHRRPQLELARGAACVRDIVALVARPPIREGQVDWAADQVLNMAQKLAQAHRICRPAAEVEGAALYGTDALPGGKISIDGVRDVQHVANLASVAVDRDR